MWIRSKCIVFRYISAVLQLADTDSLPVEGGGLHFVVAGFRITGISVAGKDEGEDKWAEFYNKTLGTSTYKEKVKPVVDKALGGALRLFCTESI